MTIAFAALPLSRAFAQRYIPAPANWSNGSGGFGAGSIAGKTVAAEGALEAGTTRESGFFKRISAGEGDDFRVCLSQHSSSGVAGVMVRNDESPDSAFVFYGCDSTDKAILIYRERAGDPSRSFAFVPPRTNPWFRLVVGRDTVYAFDAASAGTDTPGPWNPVAALKIELTGGGMALGGDMSSRRGDFGGLFVSNSHSTGSTPAIAETLYRTTPPFWSESTSKATLVNTQGANWSEAPPEPNQFAESGTVIKRTNVGASGAGHIDFPISIRTPGTYRFRVHVLAGNPSSLSASIFVNGALVEPVASIVNSEPSLNSWLMVGSQRTLAGGNTVTIRLSDPGVDGTVLYADAARAEFVPVADSVHEPTTWQYPYWVKNPAGTTRITLSAGGGPSNSVARTDLQIVPGVWNAGAHNTLGLIGDSRYRFRFTREGLRAQAGLSVNPVFLDPGTIDFRFSSLASGNAIAVGGGSSAPYPVSNSITLEIERLGNGVLFRRINGSSSSVIHSAYLPSSFTPTTPLFLDLALYDDAAKVAYSAVHGTWVYNAEFPGSVANLDLDGDGRRDSLEQWVVDANADDSIQSIFDVSGADTDGDGLSDEAEFSTTPKTNPARADSDGDGLDDRTEIVTFHTDPWNTDTDGDDLSDDIEATDPFGFDPLDPDSDPADDGVGDFTEWEIITFLPDDSFDGQEDVTADPEQDFDGDLVSNLHESEDRTSSVEAEDYFRPVVFERLFGRHIGVEHSIEANASGILSTKIIRSSASGPAGAVSHHEAKDGTRLRFQILGLDANTSGNQITVGFSHRGLDAEEPGDLANYAIAIQRTGSGEARVLFYGDPAPDAATFPVTPTDLIELSLENGALHLEKNFQPVGLPILLPAGFADIDREAYPLAIVVGVNGAATGLQNLRYRRVDDPDRDDDGMADRWEGLCGLNPLNPADANEDSEPDGLSNREEYQIGTDPHSADTDNDGMPDGWENNYGLNPKSNDDGIPDADKDGDGISNREEFDFGTRPDTPFTAGDAFSDTWRHRYGLPPTALLNCQSDADEDGRTLAAEFVDGTDPNDADTDGDGLEDGFEVQFGTDPTVFAADADNDGIGNLDELALGTNPAMPDTDGDGLGDQIEIQSTLAFDPKSADSDGDGLGDRVEHEILVHAASNGGTLLSQAQIHGGDDYDGDGVTNQDEARDTTGAANPNSHHSGSATVMPEMALKGRAYYTEGGSGGAPKEATEDVWETHLIQGEDEDESLYELAKAMPNSFDMGCSEETVNRDFSVVMVKPIYDFDGVTVIDFQFAPVSGPIAEKESRLEPYPPAQGWSETGYEETNPVPIHRWGVLIYELVEEGDPYQEGWGTDYDLCGSATPGSMGEKLQTLNGAEATKQLYEAAGDPLDPNVYWTGSLPSGSSWGDGQRREHGSEGLPAPNMDNFASFADGVYPYAYWTEYWFQARGPIPQEMGPVEKTFVIRATQSNADGAIDFQSFGTVTFTIPYGDLSKGTPTVEGLSDDTRDWIQATGDGVLVAKPPVARGKSRNVTLLPFELRDIKDHANTGDDVTISNWDTAQQIADNNIAWIEAHSSATDAAPRMPQLEFSVPGLAQNTTLEAKLLVEYERPYAGKQTDDTVRVPANGSFQTVNNGRWQIWNDYANIPFFGGDATLTYKINEGAEQIIKFAIGGRNPDDARCKTYTQGRPNAPWYAYAIEKHESQAYNPGFYNQFWERSGNSSPINNGVNYQFTRGDPLVVRSPGETGVGGAGLAQVTGAGGNKTVSASRELFWNWQRNVDSFLAIMAAKIQIAETFMNDPTPRNGPGSMPNGQRPQTTFHTGHNAAVPSRVQGRVTFGDAQGNKRPEDAIAIKAYNGASAHWCSWRGPTVHEWQFNDGQNNYVEQVGNQVEEAQP